MQFFILATRFLCGRFVSRCVVAVRLAGFTLRRFFAGNYLHFHVVSFHVVSFLRASFVSEGVVFVRVVFFIPAASFLCGQFSSVSRCVVLPRAGLAGKGCGV